MSVEEAKVFFVQCDAWHRVEGEGSEHGHRCQSRTGPHFASHRSEIPIPKDWGHRTQHDCGLTGYTSTSLYCPSCIAQFRITTDEARQVAA